ncbi:hypothetical protein [Neobacillus sp. LXY-4]|uniref:hypothetical protein n=1 Tax=Neobacillus sp. LXY-4 TaxID=3379826 RepID=UPI003EDFA094
MSTLTKRKRLSKQTTLLKNKFVAALDTLQEAKPFLKSLYQTDVFQLAVELAHSDEGLSILYENAYRFDVVGVFHGGPWEDPTKMEPSLAGGSLRLKDVQSIIELLSELRMLSIAKGDYLHDSIRPKEAESFLNEVLALNLDLLFAPALDTIQFPDHLLRAQRLFHYLGHELSFKAIADKMVQEIDRLTVQRPIITGRILNMIGMSEKLIEGGMNEETAENLNKYIRAVGAPSPLSMNASNQREYRLTLENTPAEQLELEAIIFAESMKETGLVSPFHAVLLRFLNRKHPEYISVVLGLSETGVACLNTNKDFIHDLIQLSIFPETRQAIYGLARMLERGFLTKESVFPAIFRQLFELPIHNQVKHLLSKPEYERSGISLNGVLVAGVVNVLGNPLGVGQGHNPTCQSARAISLWSQHAIGKLLKFIARAVRDNDIDMDFEGVKIHSSLLLGGVAEEINQDLDPVSTILVPHLDKIYNEMMKRTLLRGEDGHKWVNPEFYGEWVPKGFVHVIDPITLNVVHYSAFIKLFYATHHPDFNEGNKLIYPNPVGIFMTNVHGDLLGLHAVLIQRIERDPFGDVRIYFYNPNNDGNQNWGNGIVPSVSRFGEIQGESSLPFHEFVSRMYAFHYNPYDQGDIYMVENRLVDEIEKLAKLSWGKNFVWA